MIDRFAKPVHQNSNGRVAAPVVRLALVGFGYWGPKLAATLSALNGAELAVIADLSEARREAARNEYPSALILDSHVAAIDAAIDAVVVATPAGTHSLIAVAALEGGKHVLVEKPLATSLSEVDRIASAAARHGGTVMAGHTLEYHPAVDAMVGLIADGTMGCLRFVRSTRASLGLYQPDVNVMWDLAVHDLAVLLRLSGELPATVRAVGRSVAGHGRADVSWMELAFPSGLVAQIHASWIEPVKVRQMTLVGDRRMAVFDDLNRSQMLSIYDSGVHGLGPDDQGGSPRWRYRRGVAEPIALNTELPLTLECRHFVQCVATGLSPRSDLANGRRVVLVLEAADRSMRLGGVEVEASPAH